MKYGEPFFGSIIIEATPGKQPGQRKPDGLFSEHSDEQLQAQLCEIQSEIERRKLAKEEIIVLARKACADNYAHIHTKCKFIEGKRDDSKIMMVAERAVIAGMKFQKGREI